MTVIYKTFINVSNDLFKGTELGNNKKKINLFSRQIKYLELKLHIYFRI